MKSAGRSTVSSTMARRLAVRRKRRGRKGKSSLKSRDIDGDLEGLKAPCCWPPHVFATPLAGRRPRELRAAVACAEAHNSPLSLRLVRHSS